jgi:hypothetical protein
MQPGDARRRPASMDIGMTAFTRALRPLALVFLTAGAAACDPCSGTLGCGRPNIAYQGQMIARGSGQPVQGVEVTFTPHGSAAARPVRAVSDSRGHFILRTDPTSQEGVIGTVTVAGPGSAPYQVDSVRLAPIGRGNVAHLEPWLSEPVVHDLVTFFFRGNGRRLEGGTAIFRWVSGVELAAPPAPIGVSPHGQAWFELVARSGGVVHGRWEVQLPDTVLTLQSHAYDYPTEHRAGWFRFPSVAFGPVVAYRGRVVGPTGNAVADAEVTFVRSSGVEIEGDTIRTRSNGEGVFFLHPVLKDPLLHGEVRGRLEIRPPAPLAPRVVPEFSLPTHEDDDLRDLPPLALSPAA